jgi:hypothetical protein
MQIQEEIPTAGDTQAVDRPNIEPEPEPKPQETPKRKPREPAVLDKHIELPDGTLAPKLDPLYIYKVEGGFRVHYQQGGIAKFNPFTDENLVHFNALLAESEANIIKDQADKAAAAAASNTPEIQ